MRTKDFRNIATILGGLILTAGTGCATWPKWPLWEALMNEPAQVRVGAAAVQIPGDDDMVIAGGIGPGGARGDEAPQRAVALVVEGNTTLAIVMLDILMIRRDILDDATAEIHARWGIKPDNVLISSTHTHHAPSTVTVHGYERDEEYCRRVRDAIVEAVGRANGQLESARPSEMVFALGEESSVGQNSRLLLGDETIFWVGPREDAVRPTGPFDPELPVIAFRDPESGGYETVLFNHSTHNIGVGEGGKRSPGFYGLAAQKLERELGATTLFLSGAYGSTHNLSLRTPEMVHRITTAVKRGLASATVRAQPRLAAVRREFTYRVREFDEAEEDAAVVKYCTKRLGGDPSYTINVFRKMRRELAEQQGEPRTTWLQVMRLGDVYLVAVPGECFTLVGQWIKRRSPHRYTYVCGTANDYIGYIPDREAYELGGYQVWTGFHSHVAPGTAEAMADEAVRMLHEVAGR